MVFFVRDFSTSSHRYLRASTDAFVSFVNGVRPPMGPSPADATLIISQPSPQLECKGFQKCLGYLSGIYAKSERPTCLGVGMRIIINSTSPHHERRQCSVSDLKIGHMPEKTMGVTTIRLPHTLWRSSATVREILIQLLVQESILYSEQRDGCARLPGPARPAHSVHIGLHARRKVLRRASCQSHCSRNMKELLPSMWEAAQHGSKSNAAQLPNQKSIDHHFNAFCRLSPPMCLAHPLCQSAHNLVQCP